MMSLCLWTLWIIQQPSCIVQQASQRVGFPRGGKGRGSPSELPHPSRCPLPGKGKVWSTVCELRKAGAGLCLAVRWSGAAPSHEKGAGGGCTGLQPCAAQRPGKLRREA